MSRTTLESASRISQEAFSPLQFRFMIQKVVAFAGYSNSGKTTLLCSLIEHFTSRGIEVGAIKHTHHPLNELPTGDTGRFLEAGARTAILAGANEAIAFMQVSSGIQPNRFSWKEPSDLTLRLDTGLVLIEGFKKLGAWPKVLVGRSGAATPPPDPTVIACVGGSPVLPGVRRFEHDDLKGLAGFLDRILGL